MWWRIDSRSSPSGFTEGLYPCLECRCTTHDEWLFYSQHGPRPFASAPTWWSSSYPEAGSSLSLGSWLTSPLGDNRYLWQYCMVVIFHSAVVIFSYEHEMCSLRACAVCFQCCYRSESVYFCNFHNTNSTPLSPKAFQGVRLMPCLSGGAIGKRFLASGRFYHRSSRTTVAPSSQMLGPLGGTYTVRIGISTSFRSYYGTLIICGAFDAYFRAFCTIAHGYRLLKNKWFQMPWAMWHCSDSCWYRRRSIVIPFYRTNACLLGKVWRMVLSSGGLLEPGLNDLTRSGSRW